MNIINIIYIIQKMYHKENYSNVNMYILMDYLESIV